MDEIVFTKVENPRWHDADHFSIVCDVTVEGMGKLPYAVGHRTDTPYGMKLWRELQDGVHGPIAPYVPPPELTAAEKRAMMPTRTPREFRDRLIDNNIMPEDVTAQINRISDPKLRAKALNAWEYPTEFSRLDPLIDEIGAMFGLSPEDIDAMW
ncbi:hypothetical protein BR10RB9215_C11150 [Brucella sp. 10RB9215]|uniref:hypothetical protein n=1 Tax=unclassified Brucella TaxID=2632610 RepID=UPI00084F9C45|nr:MULTISPECIES: hypothetical protein [unclassified Brucella]OEI84348.1 hypothetical protein BA060_03890 [Brucella sp. B13-0095]QMV26823.1 hypothetical protein GRI33_07780 [Brucella sp. BO3]SBW14324.1 hypothetical protein BR10RB9215_C11150 [Brucella sp. 10RB9215]